MQASRFSGLKRARAFLFLDFGFWAGLGSAKFVLDGWASRYLCILTQMGPRQRLDTSLGGTPEVRTFWNIWQVPCSVFILTELKTFVGISGN